MRDLPPTDAPAEAIDRYLQRAVPFGFAGAVLVAMGDDVRLACGYGWADRDTRRANGSATVFSLGSVTKPITSTAVLRLVDTGRISLTDSIGGWFPSAPADKAAITVEQLLSHTAGLIDATGEDFDPGERADVIQAIFAASLRFPPGSSYAYSNAGYSVLATLLEEVTGEQHEVAMRELVLEPAGMDRTGYVGPAWDRAAMAHFYVGDTDVGLHLDKPYPSWHIVGNGEMLSTVHDLYRLTRAIDAGLLNARTRDEAWTPRHGGYGLGWSVTDGNRGRIVSHDGASTNGASASLRWYRDSDTVVAVLCNRDYGAGFLVHAVEPRIETLLFGEAAPEPPSVPPTPQEPVAGLAGDYTTDAGDRAIVRRVTDGHLVAFTGQSLIDLVAGATPDPDDAARADRTLGMLRSLLAGDDAPLLAALDGDRERVERYRRFATDRLGTHASVVELDGSMPAEISVGATVAVQLSGPGESAESVLRVYWQGSTLVGFGYGVRPLLEVPLVAVGRDRFVIHHLALGATVEVSMGGREAGALMTLRAEDGRTVTARRAG